MSAHYKDSLFRSLFNNPAAVRELYNALKGTTFGPNDRIVINTLERENPGLSRDAVVERAVAAAIEYCKRRDILKEYWESLSMEETMRLTGEWKWEEALEVRDEENFRRGQNRVLDLMKQGYTADQIERLLAADAAARKRGDAERGRLETRRAFCAG